MYNSKTHLSKSVKKDLYKKRKARKQIRDTKRNFEGV